MTDHLLNKHLPSHGLERVGDATLPQGGAGRPEKLPPQFWDDASHTLRLDALLNAYHDLEMKLQALMQIPGHDAVVTMTDAAQNGALGAPLDDAVRAHMLRALGVPDSPDGYSVTLKNDHIEVDPMLNARLHQKGFTCAQVQEVYDLACEKLVPLIVDMAAEFEAERESERLRDYFGGSSKFEEIAHQLREFGQKNLPAPAYNGLCCSYDGVMALYQMMTQNGRSGAPVMRGGSGIGAAHDEVSLRKMMQDPRYWRDRDPRFIAQVTEGFDRLYQSQEG